MGSTFTAAQKAAVRAGTFEDLFLGDHWVINGITWRIVDMDYWLNTGDTRSTRHHLVIMPDHTLKTEAMNPTDTTDGGYVGTELRAHLIDAQHPVHAEVEAAFGDALLTHRAYLANAVSGGAASAGAWYDSAVEVPSEIMLFGSRILSKSMIGDADRTQLSLFSVCPRSIVDVDLHYWVRDVGSASSFDYVDNHGELKQLAASVRSGIRPVFPVG